ncbi:Glucose-6-phosphate/phosphate and phosphoenolpyruvate/phosphate antiporter [Klebsormidium nitens]|uniref:Glucose-6-phosphate/phosphate and phosphoenolpyruvate/phosphate antiporter n=1 Tax=Klebsormidium nitens TaxID=105231 RepID=A0A1Y1IJY9_KLENI|nr:Glucose-6-phosphate/phosphate and phosphoenolpyruvate/phosphate antiporter [Klebsormidium nitens]|eukprot:GAQ90452.1 Glucose-6-phosphate/phosphate and phosphoenolpyruvate/phosphate antiporter [Klebsormidium nitens]
MTKISGEAHLYQKPGQITGGHLGKAQELDMDGKRSLENLVSATGGRGAGGGDKAAAAAQSFYQLMSVLQWWFFNVVVVISNKYIFQIFGFKFPLTLITIHFIMSALGAYLTIKVFKLKPEIVVQSTHDKVVRIMPVAALTCLNIVLGNVLLRFVPVSFMQTIKCFTPATTLILQRAVWGRKFDSLVYLALIPIVFGVVLTTVAELSFNWTGFLTVLAACLTTSTSNIMAEALLQGKYAFDSINTVYYMAPYSTALLILPALFYEGADVSAWAAEQDNIALPLTVILVGGSLAFCLNFSLFYVIQATSAVTFNVAGNLKVALAIIISWMIFRNPMGWLSWVGCLVTIVGCTFYGWVQQKIKAQKAPAVAVSEMQDKQPLMGSSK